MLEEGEQGREDQFQTELQAVAGTLDRLSGGDDQNKQRCESAENGKAIFHFGLSLSVAHRCSVPYGE